MGFEPTVRLRTSVFKTDAFDRSAISPKWSPGWDSNPRCGVTHPPYKSGAFDLWATRACMYYMMMLRFYRWCAKRDLNPQAVGHRLLRPACIPFHHPRVMWSGRQDSNLRHSVPKTDALPDCATPRIWLPKSGSNRRPAPCKGAALPLSYSAESMLIYYRST